MTVIWNLCERLNNLNCGKRAPQNAEPQTHTHTHSIIFGVWAPLSCAVILIPIPVRIPIPILIQIIIPDAIVERLLFPGHLSIVEACLILE